jgi:hypothetical protein
MCPPVERERESALLPCCRRVTPTLTTNPLSLGKSSNLRSRISLGGRRIPASVGPFCLESKHRKSSICPAREGWWKEEPESRRGHSGCHLAAPAPRRCSLGAGVQGSWIRVLRSRGGSGSFPRKEPREDSGFMDQGERLRCRVTRRIHRETFEKFDSFPTDLGRTYLP